MAPVGVRRAWALSSFSMLTNFLLEGGTVDEHFAKTSDIDDNGRFIRKPDALRSLTLCNCDCKLLTSAICRGLHGYTMRCIHPSQRCISSSQMTDNIFEIETTALAHVACTAQESGIMLTDFAAAYPSVNHSWILSVLEKTELTDCICRFLRSIYNAHMFSWRLHVSGRCYALNTDYGLPCNTCTDTLGIWVLNADDAAALGSLGLISSHNDATCWVRHNFDTSACCDGCISINEILERLHSIRTEATSLPQDGSKCCVHHRVLLCLSYTHFCHV